MLSEQRRIRKSHRDGCPCPANLTGCNCSAKMSPHEGDSDVEPRGTAASAGAERGDRGRTDGWEGGGVAGAVGATSSAPPGSLSEGGGCRAGPWQPRKETGQHPEGGPPGAGAGQGPH